MKLMNQCNFFYFTVFTLNFEFFFKEIMNSGKYPLFSDFQLTVSEDVVR